MPSQSISNKDLKIVQLNVNSLISHERRHNLNQFLIMHKPHAALIAETNLHAKHKLNFKNYNFIRTNKPTAQNGRGTGILINAVLKYEEVNTYAWNLKSLETTAIILETVENKKYLVVSAYRPAGTVFNTSDLQTISDFANKQANCSLIIGGDFNARHINWCNTNPCPSGNALAKWITQNAMQKQLRLVHSAMPTYYKGNYSSYLDFYILSERVDVVFPTSTPGMLSILDYASDHRAVELLVANTGQLTKAPAIQIPNYSNTDWKKFNSFIDRGIDDIHVPNNINISTAEADDAIFNLTTLINSTIESTVPKIVVHSRGLIPIPNELQQLIAKKNRLRRRWLRKRYSHNEYLLRSEINCIEKIIRDSIRIVHTQHWEKSLSNVKLDNHTFSNIRKFTGRFHDKDFPHILKNPATPSIPVTTAHDKANLLANHFKSIHQQNHNLGEADLSVEVTNYIRTQHSEPPRPRFHFSQHATANPSFIFNPDRHLVSINMLFNFLKSRKNKKSRGDDGISNFVLKKLSLKFVTLLATLFNQLYNIAYFPHTWKHALVVPILKKGKSPSIPSSYRPISLLSCLSKLYELSIKPVLDNECNVLKTTPSDQCGFTGLLSTIHPLILVSTDVNLSINARTPTIACALDIEKAFDTVWTHGLIFKMNRLGFSKHIVTLVLSYLTGRSFRVLVNNTTSTERSITAGVPQGGVLSALLYIIYLSDLPLPPDNSNIKRLQYADDIFLYTSTKNLKRGQTELNKYLEQVSKYMHKWKIKPNPTKAESIVFKGNYADHSKSINKNHKNVKLLLNGQPIPLKDEIKYLGILFTKKPTFVKHVSATLSKANDCYHSIKPILHRTRGLNMDIKLLCYKQLIRPVITYGFPAWSGISAHQMELIRRFERKCIRSCVTYRQQDYQFKRISNSDLYSKGDIERIDNHMIRLCLKTFEKWPSDNPVFKDCIQHSADYLNDSRNKLKPPWVIQHLFNTSKLLPGIAPEIYHQRYSAASRHLGPVYATQM